jgi:hypothetical protein
MTTKNETDLLNDRLIVVTNKRAADLILLKEQFHLAYESVKPINLIKTLFHDVATSPEIKNNVVNTAVGISAGFLSEKLLFGNSNNPLKRGLGTLFQFAVANLVSNNSQRIQSVGKNLLKFFSKSKMN